jgi:hypothetical protein
MQHFLLFHLFLLIDNTSAFCAAMLIWIPPYKNLSITSDNYQLLVVLTIDPYEYTLSDISRRHSRSPRKTNSLTSFSSLLLTTSDLTSLSSTLFPSLILRMSPLFPPSSTMVSSYQRQRRLHYVKWLRKIKNTSFFNPQRISICYV